ncbi:MAG: hypothetical protein ABI785_11415 [Gemmatimonadales bacterium]
MPARFGRANIISGFVAQPGPYGPGYTIGAVLRTATFPAPDKLRFIAQRMLWSFTT